MDGITGGRCQESYATRGYHHTLREKIHKLFVQPAMLYGMETVPMTSFHTNNVEVTEMKMCRWACGQTRIDHVRNDDIRERLKVENITERCRKARLRWFGTRQEAIPRIRRKKDSGHGTTWEKKARKTEAEMDGLYQPGHESHRNEKKKYMT